MSKILESKTFILNLILLFILLLIIIADIFLYVGDVLVQPYITIFVILLITSFKSKTKRVLVINLIFVIVSLISFLYLKPKYTVNEGKKILEENFEEATDLGPLGYVKRKNMFVRGAYVFSKDNGELIIFNNNSGDYHIANP